MKLSKPSEEEFSPYAEPYIKLLPDDGEVLQHLKDDYQKLKSLIAPLKSKKLNERYAEGKWMLKEVLVHMMDSERILTGRALRIARSEQANLPGFDQENYVDSLQADARTAESIFREFDAVRSATLSLFNTFSPEQIKRTGMADGTAISVRALAYMMAGHQRHHINTIQEKYLD